MSVHESRAAPRIYDLRAYPYRLDIGVDSQSGQLQAERLFYRASLLLFDVGFLPPFVQMVNRLLEGLGRLACGLEDQLLELGEPSRCRYILERNVILKKVDDVAPGTLNAAKRKQLLGIARGKVALDRLETIAPSAESAPDLSMGARPQSLASKFVPRTAEDFRPALIGGGAAVGWGGRWAGGRGGWEGFRTGAGAGGGAGPADRAGMAVAAASAIFAQ